MPSFRELVTLLRLQSTNSASQLVKRLVEEGFVEKDDTGRIIPGAFYGEVKLLGLVEAGFPSETEEGELDTLTLDEWLVANHSATYLLRVKGDSMKDAGINEGDYILAERTDKHEVGDIVIAEVDGQWTLKYLRKEKAGYYLEAANDEYPNIYPTESLNISGKVRAVIRRYDV